MGLIILWLGTCLGGSLCYGQSVPRDTLTEHRRVTMKAETMSLREAIRTLEQQAGLDLVYNDALIEGIVVTFSCADMPWRDALTALLASTPLTFRVMDDGQVVLVKKPPAVSRAGGRVAMTGYVRDADTGEPLPYANVALKGTPYGTASNADGFFSLVHVPTGAYVLQARYVGYHPVEQPVTAAEPVGRLTVRMRSTPVRLGEVTVTDHGPAAIAQGEAPGLVQLSPRRLSSLPSFGETDLFRSLLLLPGFQSTSDGSVGLFVRGGVPDQNLILLDGMTIYFVDHFFGFISAFNAEAIQNVRVFKGGFPAKYGGRISSVIELTGRTGSIERVQASANINLLSGSGMLQLPLGRRAAWLVTFRRSLTDFLKSGIYTNIFDTITGQAAADNPRDADGQLIFNDEGYGSIRPDFFYYDLNSKLTVVPSSRDVLTLSVFNGGDNLDQVIQDAYEIEQNNALVVITDQDATASNWGNTGLSGKWARIWSDQVYTNALVAYSRYFNRHRFSYRSTTPDESLYSFFGNEGNTIVDFTFRLDNEWHLDEAHSVEFGAWLSHTDVTYLAEYIEKDDTLDVYVEKAKGGIAAFYLQDQWSPTQRLNVTLGGRATYFEPTGQTYLEPRFSAHFALSPRVRLKGAWGHYRQLINRVINDDALAGTRDFWLLSDPELEPSFAAHSILGLAYETEHYLLDVEAYHKDLDGVTEFSQRFADDPKGFFFTGKGTAQGVEVLAQRKTGRFKGWLSYALSEVYYRFDELNGGAPFPATQDRRHTFTAVGEVALGPWMVSANWTWASGRPYTVPESRYSFVGIDGTVHVGVHIGPKNTQRLPVYHRLDASLRRHFRRGPLGLDVALSLFNVYDRQNVWYRQYRLDIQPVRVRDVMMLGLTPMVSLKASFN